MPDAYDMAVTLGTHCKTFIKLDDDDVGYEIDIVALKKLIQQLLDVAKIYDDND